MSVCQAVEFLFTRKCLILVTNYCKNVRCTHEHFELKYGKGGSKLVCSRAMNGLCRDHRVNHYNSFIHAVDLIPSDYIEYHKSIYDILPNEIIKNAKDLVRPKFLDPPVDDFCPILEMPVEILDYIFSMLERPYKSFKAIAGTCTYFRDVICTDLMVKRCIEKSLRSSTVRQLKVDIPQLVVPTLTTKGEVKWIEKILSGLFNVSRLPNKEIYGEVNGQIQGGIRIKGDVIWDFKLKKRIFKKLQIFKECERGEILIMESFYGITKRFYESGVLCSKNVGNTAIGYYEDGSERIIVTKEYSTVLYESGKTKAYQEGDEYTEYYEDGSVMVRKNSTSIITYLETGEIEGEFYIGERPYVAIGGWEIKMPKGRSLAEMNTFGLPRSVVIPNIYEIFNS